MSIGVEDFRLGRAVSAQADHWRDEEMFRQVEAERRRLRESSGSAGRFFISHCWRNADTQAIKRQVVAKLSDPAEAGGGGIAYWADFLDLQAEGPVPWRAEIEEGIATCSKFVAMIDAAWATSFNCLQELAMAFKHSKPVVAIILDQEAWELLTVPGGAEIAKTAADSVKALQAPEPSGIGSMTGDAALSTAWLSSQHGVPLFLYQDEDIVPGQPLSLRVVQNLFSRLASINLCPCRPLDIEVRGLSSVLDTTVKYVNKNISYHHEHGHLSSVARRWKMEDSPKRLLLQHKEALKWKQWLSMASKADLEPLPTEHQTEFVAASLKASTRRRQLFRVLAAVLIFVIIAAAAACAVLAVVANGQEAAAKRAENVAQEAAQSAMEAMSLAEAEADRALKAQQEALLWSKDAIATGTLSLVSAVTVAHPWAVRAVDTVLTSLSDPLLPWLNADAVASARHLLGLPVKASSTVQGHESFVHSAAWAPDCAAAASSGVDNRTVVWSVSKSPEGVPSLGAVPLHVISHPAPVWDCSWLSPNVLITGAQDGFLRSWATGETQGVTEAAEVLSAADGTSGVRLVFETEVFPGGAVLSLAWSPASQLVAVGGVPANILVYTLASLSEPGMSKASRQPAVLAGHTDNVWSLTWSPSGVLLASGSQDGTVRVWQPFGLGSPGSTLSANDTSAAHQILPDGGDGTSLVFSVAWSPGGGWLASGSSEHFIRVWHVIHPSAGAIAPAGDLSAGSLEVVDPMAEPQLLSIQLSEARSVAWAPGGVYLAAASTDTTVWLWAAAAGGAPGCCPGVQAVDASSLYILEGHTAVVSTVAWAPQLDASAGDSGVQQLQLVSGSSDSRLQLWRAQLSLQNSGGSSATLEMLNSTWAPAITWRPSASPQFQGSLLAAGCLDGSLQIWRTNTVQKVAEAEMGAAPSLETLLRDHNDAVRAVAWHHSGSLLASGSVDGDVLVYLVGNKGGSPPLLSAALSGQEGNSVRAMSWAPPGAAGAAALVSVAVEGSVVLWQVDGQGHPEGSTSTVQLSDLPDAYAVLSSVAWSPSGHLLAIAMQYYLVLLGVEAGQLVQSPQQYVPAHDDWVYSVSWSHQTGLLATGGGDGVVRVWSLDDNCDCINEKSARVLVGHTSPVSSVEWSPSGELLASGSGDGSARVWHLGHGMGEGQQPEGSVRPASQALAGHQAAVWSVSWSSDGRQLATAAADDTVKTWTDFSVEEARDQLRAVFPFGNWSTTAEDSMFGIPYTLVSASSMLQHSSLFLSAQGAD